MTLSLTRAESGSLVPERTQVSKSTSVSLASSIPMGTARLCSCWGRGKWENPPCMSQLESGVLPGPKPILRRGQARWCHLSISGSACCGGGWLLLAWGPPGKGSGWELAAAARMILAGSEPFPLASGGLQEDMSLGDTRPKDCPGVYQAWSFELGHRLHEPLQQRRNRCLLSNFLQFHPCVYVYINVK